MSHQGSASALSAALDPLSSPEAPEPVERLATEWAHCGGPLRGTEACGALAGSGSVGQACIMPWEKHAGTMPAGTAIASWCCCAWPTAAPQLVQALTAPHVVQVMQPGGGQRCTPAAACGTPAPLTWLRAGALGWLRCCKWPVVSTAGCFILRLCHESAPPAAAHCNGAGLLQGCASPCPRSMRNFLAASATGLRRPKTATRNSSCSKVTPASCATSCRSVVSCALGVFGGMGTDSSVHWVSSSSIRLLAMAMFSDEPKSLSSQRPRSMCTRQPVMCWRPATLACEVTCAIRVRMSSAQTAVDTCLRGPPRVSSCLCAAWMDSSVPAIWRRPRALSSFILTWQVAWMSRRRRRLRRLRVLSSSGSRRISFEIVPGGNGGAAVPSS
mmetsp:Transcript_26584/g.76615  ORF Transcript_26584/g.76615 Transcript_26584/m.76615 type:complete len:385 (+) Transcript_26584:252-1406(+)